LDRGEVGTTARFEKSGVGWQSLADALPPKKAVSGLQ
jgi:hypothetical protein